MKRILLLGTAFTAAAAGIAADFRGTFWGDSPETIRKGEDAYFLSDTAAKGGADSDGTRVIRFYTTVGGEMTMVVYRFLDGSLVKAEYLFILANKSDDEFLNASNEWADRLKKKYGEPNEVTDLWNDEEKRLPGDQWAKAIKSGMLTKAAGWQTERSNIILALTGLAGKLHLKITYQDKANVRAFHRRAAEAAEEKI